MKKILISSCLAGYNVRYNGSCLAMNTKDMNWIKSNFKILHYCPEVSAGLPTPRAPAEIIGGTGSDVLDGRAEVVRYDGVNVTNFFRDGAKLALQYCLNQGVKYAVLAESSPSCGSSTIYNGTFSGNKITGRGVTAALLERHDIHVFSQNTMLKLKKGMA